MCNTTLSERFSPSTWWDLSKLPITDTDKTVFSQLVLYMILISIEYCDITSVGFFVAQSFSLTPTISVIKRFHGLRKFVLKNFTGVKKYIKRVMIGLSRDLWQNKSKLRIFYEVYVKKKNMSHLLQRVDTTVQLFDEVKSHPHNVWRNKNKLTSFQACLYD